jgi:hypothetical protein
LEDVFLDAVEIKENLYLSQSLISIIALATEDKLKEIFNPVIIPSKESLY